MGPLLDRPRDPSSMLDELIDPNQSGWSGPYSEDWKSRVADLKERGWKP